MSKTFLFGHTSKATAYEVTDYPYGFRLRTSIFYWIETVPKKGCRFVSQTINPKTGRLNAEKKSTFYVFGVMNINEDGHIGWNAVSPYDTSEDVSKFVETIGGVDKLNAEQRKQYNSMMGINEKVIDEFTGAVKKDYAIKWEKDKEGKYREVRITFDRPDGVKVKEMFEAMAGLNQKKLDEVFAVREDLKWGNYTGNVRICTRGGNQLGTVSEESYREYLASDEYVTRNEK